MEKLYLLLRKNQQSGPYTIDELVQQQLLPSDLIWVEGVSQSWCYPSDLKELKPTFTKSGTRKTVVSKNVKQQEVAKNIDADASQPTAVSPLKLEQRAEELRKNILSYQPGYYQNKPYSSQKVQHHPEPEDDGPIRFVFHKKRHNNTVAQAMVMCMLIVFIVVSHYKGWSPFASQSKAAEEEVAIPLVSTSQHTALRPKPEPAPVIAQLPVADTTQLAKPMVEKAKPRVFKTSQPTEALLASSRNTLGTESPSSNKNADLKASDNASSVTNTVATGSADNKETATDNNNENIKKDVAQKPDEPVAKKRGLGQMLKGLFKRKKKEETGNEASE